MKSSLYCTNEQCQILQCSNLTRTLEHLIDILRYINAVFIIIIIKNGNRVSEYKISKKNTYSIYIVKT